MRRKHKGKWTFLRIATLATVGFAAAFTVRALRLPHPDAANRQELMRWLVMQDISVCCGGGCAR